MQLQVLRTWSRILSPGGVRPPDLAAPRVLLRAVAVGALEPADVLPPLLATGLAPPAGLRDPGALAGVALDGFAARSVLVVWWWSAGEPDVAAGLMAAGLDPAHRWGRALAPWGRAGGGAELSRLLAAVRERAPERADTVDRIALGAGLLGGPERQRVLGGLAASDELGDLALLAAGEPPASARARRALLERLEAGLDPAQGASLVTLTPTLEALEEALEGLVRLGADGEALALRAQAMQRIREAPQSSLREQLRLSLRPHFPPPLAAREPARLDRP